MIHPDQAKRLDAWRKILHALKQLEEVSGMSYDDVHPYTLDALGAVGFLMMDHTAETIRRRRELNEEIRAGQRDARESYNEGRNEGARGEW
jgi:hypothetical protein